MNKVRWFSAVRVYGLILVLMYHLFYSYLPGGFLGVDIFFTFSGFLITSVIIGEIRSKKRFDIIRFYKRRATRIFIPLFFTVIFTLPFLLMISPDFSVGIGRQVTAAFGFVTNWFQISSGNSYEAQLLPSFYVHTWSLSVEMQFYILWGLVCAFLALVSKLISKNNAELRIKLFKMFIFGVSLIFTVLSFLYMISLYNKTGSPDKVYFNTLTRLCTFFIGSLAASLCDISMPPADGRRQRRREGNPSVRAAVLLIILSLCAAGAILVMAVKCKYADSFVYRYGFLLTGVCAAVLIICSYRLHLLTPPDVKEPRLLSAVSDLSYSIYLYHWPLYVAFSAYFRNNFTAALITLAFSLAFSFLTFFIFERVLASAGGLGKMKRGRAAAVFTAAAVTASLFPGAAVLANAPSITSIEESFAENYVIQDADRMTALLKSIAAVNPEPVATPFDPQGNSNFVSSYISPEPEDNPDIYGLSGGVTVIGDSVVLGVQKIIAEAIPGCSVNAETSRSISQGADILAELQETGELRKYVVIALGTNGVPYFENQFLRFIEEIEPGHALIFVTPFDGRDNENSEIADQISEWERSLPDLYDFVTIADWNSLISGQSDLLAADMVHMGGPTSSGMYAECIADAVEEASQKPLK